MTKTKRIFFAIATALFLMPALASAQSVTIVSGNGQLTCPNCLPNNIQFLDPLIVLVRDAAGRPVPGVIVTWTIANGQGAQLTLLAAQTTTDANGQSSNTGATLLPVPGALFALSFVQSMTTATALGASVTFTETASLSANDVSPGNGSSVNQVTASIQSPQPGTTLSGPAGSTSTVPVQIRIVGLNGAGVPGVAIALTTDPSQPQTVSCQPTPGNPPNTALSDATGTATCNIVFGPALGTGQFSILIGDHFGQFINAVSFTVLPGIPAGFRTQSGNGQSANAGMILPSPLVALVLDQGGNALAGVPVTWAVVSGSATLFNQVTTSDANGRVSVNVTLGGTPGQVQIRVTVASNTAITLTFTATVNVVVTGLQKLAGDSQSTPVNTTFPQALVVQVNNAGQPVANVGVSFTVTSGSGVVQTPNANTDASGRAQTVVQAGGVIGNLVITAAISGLTQTFNLIVVSPGPAITPNSFLNAASGEVGKISPCGLATIVAPGMAPGLQGAILPPIVGVLPLVVNNLVVAFLNPATNTNSYAPIWAVANINGTESATIQIPCELPPGSVNVTASVAGGNKTVTVTLLPAAPGVFQEAGSDKKLRAVVIREDGSFATKENPVRPGEIAHVLVTNLGAMNPQVGTNQIGIPDTDTNVANTVVVGVNNSGVEVRSARYARNLIGIYDVAFVVPGRAPDDVQPLAGDNAFAVAVNIGGTLVFGNGSVIPIQP